jgi:hypothetical protein
VAYTHAWRERDQTSSETDEAVQGRARRTGIAAASSCMCYLAESVGTQAGMPLNWDRSWGRSRGRCRPQLSAMWERQKTSTEQNQKPAIKAKLSDRHPAFLSSRFSFCSVNRISPSTLSHHHIGALMRYYFVPSIRSPAFSFRLGPAVGQTRDTSHPIRNFTSAFQFQ